MGTKNNPGKFDCYSKAEPDEPVFVLLGRDPAAPLLVHLWAEIRARMGEEQEKVEEAYSCEHEMGLWLARHDKGPAQMRAIGVFDDLLREHDRTKQLESITRKFLEAACSNPNTRWVDDELVDEATELLGELE